MTIGGGFGDIGEDLPDSSFCSDFYARYEPREILGRGVSSTVRKCIEKGSGREYAVKIIDVSGEDSDNAAEVAELKYATSREISVLRACAGHEHIIELHDMFESETYIFLIFELCQHGELFDYLTEMVTLSEKRTRQIMRQLLEAVCFIHDKNIVHRDLKPENVLLDDTHNVKLTDFGFAVNLDEEPEPLTDLCGTPGYLAPEVLAVQMYENSPGYGKEVDMWAIGVIMYTLLVGCPPFWHRKQMYMLRMIMEGKYQFGSPEWDDISEPPKDLISRLLIVEPSERLTAIEALAHPFFTREEVVTEKRFFARRKFKAAIIVVRACHIYWKMHLNPPAQSLTQLRADPYRIKDFRRLIDSCAFHVYNHWVKKGDDQNRAALFEVRTRRDLKIIMAAEGTVVDSANGLPVNHTFNILKGLTSAAQARGSFVS